MNLLRDIYDVQKMLEALLCDILQGMLDAEADKKLGYSKYDYPPKKTMIARSFIAKTVASSLVPLCWMFRKNVKENLHHRTSKSTVLDTLIYLC